MPESGYRLDLWRKALSLFYERRKPAWVGPFKQAGYAGLGVGGLQIGPKLLDAEGNEGTPDIVSASETHWIAMEITADEHKPKKAQLDKYAALDGDYLTNHGLPYVAGHPNVLIGRSKPPQPYADDGDYTRLILGDTLLVERPEGLADATLQATLVAFQGQALTQAPELPFTLLPERKSPIEIRRGIVSSVMSIFHPGSDGVTVKQMVDDGLDTLVHSISIEARQRLQNDVERQMDILLGQHKLSEYVLKEGRTYKSKIPDKLPASQTLKKAQGIVEGWVKQTAPQATLSEEYPSSSSSSEKGEAPQ